MEASSQQQSHQQKSHGHGAKKVKVSILILDYKKAERVCQNVASVMQQEVDFSVQTIVIDNSCDQANANMLQDLGKKYPGVDVIINDENLGYIRGYNQAVDLSNGEYLLIVNPDIVWRDPKTLAKLVTFMENNPQVGICGPKQINDDTGERALTVRAFPRLYRQVARRTWLRKIPLLKKIVAYDEMDHLDYDKTQPVDWLQSSFIILRRSLWDSLGGLNEDYFIFMADPDLCFKCWKSGLEVVYFPKVVVYADGRRASAGGFRTFFKSWVLRQHFKDALRFRLNFFGQKNPRKEYMKKLAEQGRSVSYNENVEAS